MTSSIVRLFALGTLLGACSGSGPVTTVIVAAEGGTVVTSTHDIQIPPASLATDTEVTLDMGDPSALPAVPGDRSVILRLEPEGTRLETAATVTIHGSEIGASSDDVVAVFQFVDGGWGAREFSRDSETGDISTSVSYFAPLGVGITAPAEGGGVIAGVVRWGSGMVIEGALVELYLGETQVQMTQTSAEGLYRFENLESGIYNVCINFECAVDQAVGVAEGMTVMQDIVVCG